MFKHDDMAALVAAVDDKFTTAGKNNASFTGKKVLRASSGTFYQDMADVTPPGWRTEFLTQMGFAIPDGVDEFVRTTVPWFRATSWRRVLDAADVADLDDRERRGAGRAARRSDRSRS